MASRGLAWHCSKSGDGSKMVESKQHNQHMSTCYRLWTTSRSPEKHTGHTLQGIAGLGVPIVGRFRMNQAVARFSSETWLKRTPSHSRIL